MYALLIISVLCAGINNALLHILSAKKTKYDPLLFNAAISLVWLIGLVIYNDGFKGYFADTFTYGLIYGFSLIGFIFFKSMAMTTGPVAPTALVGCSSFIVAASYSVEPDSESL